METLGAYLLRSGVLNKDTLAAALDRQVVYGGWLDTALLELGLLDEPRIADLLSSWSGYPVTARGWLEMADTTVIELLPQSLAVAHVVVPFASSPEGVWVATPAPVDVDALAQLAAAMGQPVLPHVSSEYRIRLALRMHYGVPLDARFDELAGYLLSRQIPQEAESARPPLSIPPTAGLSTSDASGVTVEQPGFGGEVILPAPEPAPLPEPPPPEEPEPVGSLDLVEALAFLAAAEDRDAIVNIAVRYALQAFPFVAFLGILRGHAVVWQARAHTGELPADPGALKGIRLPLDERSPLRTVVETRAPSLGSAAYARAGQNLSEKLGRKVPRAMLLLPILVGGRVVGVLYADHGDWAIRTQQVSEVMAFCSRIGPAFENLIRERRTKTIKEQDAHTQPPPVVEPPPPEQPMAMVDAAVEALANQPAPSEPPREAWVVDEHRPANSDEPLPPPPESTPVQQQWVVASPGEVETPAASEITLEPVAPETVEATPADDEPLRAEARYTPSPDDDDDEDEDAGNEEPIELETPAQPTPAPTPSRTLSPEAAALAAAALARAQLGGDDDDGDDEEAVSPSETPLARDSTWTQAMQDALVEKEAAIGKFETKADWQTDLANAAANVPVQPIVATLADDDDDDDEESAAPKPGEEAVVFAEIADGSTAQVSAFTNALTETIASGKQGGEMVEEGWRAFARPPPDDDDDDEEEASPGWEAVVFDAAAQVERDRAQAAPVEASIAHAVEEAASSLPMATPVATPVVTLPPPPPKEEVLIDPPRVWVEALVSGQADRVAAAQLKIMELGQVVMPALSAAFPGRVQWDPFGADAQTPEPSQVSALVDVVARMGMMGLQAAVPHLDSKFPAHRYFATLLLSRVYQPASIPYLLRRLHDDEPRIRKLAGDALASYVAEPGFEQVLRHLRTRISSVVPEGRRRAIHFLGRFRDVGSIPALINALRGKEAEIVQEAAQALHAITLQSLGTSERKWSAWWEKNKHRSRIEWLIDALKDSDVEVRARAGQELAQLTRDTFGFKADAPRKDRDAAVKRWERWWADERRRLVGSPA